MHKNDEFTIRLIILQKRKKNNVTVKKKEKAIR